MRLREFFAGQPKLAKLGALRFNSSIFKDEVRHPHFEMKKVLDMLEQRPLITSGNKQIARFIFGNEMTIVSTDERTSDFLNKWLEKRPQLKHEVFNFMYLGVALGNAYLEPSYVKTKSGLPLLDMLFNVPDPSRVYKYLDAKEEDEYWLYEVPKEVRQYNFGGGVKLPKFWKYNYIQGSYLFQQFVWAVPVHKNKLVHFKLGWSRDGIYGRGYLASAIDDNDVLTEIIKNYAVIARYRALGKKIISIGDENNIADAADIIKLEDDLRQLQDEDHIIINKPFKAEPLSYTGENDAMDSQIDFLRRDISSGLVPNYLTPWNSDVNRATAGEVKIPFQLELQYMREQFIMFLNKVIIGELKKVYPWLAEDATLQFGTVELEAKDERMEYSRELYDAGIITFNEFRKAAGYEPVEGGDKFVHDLKPPVDYVDFSDEPLPEAVIKRKPEVYKELFDAKSSDKKWKNRLVNRKLYKRSETNNFKVVQRNNIGGKELRLVTNEKKEKFLIFNGIRKLKDFELDEKEPAIAFYDNVKKKLKDLQGQFLTGETPEDKIIKDFFKELKRAYAEVLDEFFQEMDKNKVKKEAFLSSNIMGGVDKIFGKFNDKAWGIVGKVMKKVYGQLVEPPVGAGNDTRVDANSVLGKRLQVRSELLLNSRTFGQIKTFNRKAASDIQRIMADGIAAGRKIKDIKKEIKDKYVDWKVKGAPQDYQIDRIVRTELNNNINLLRMKKWADQGFENYEWVTVEDERVRPTHRVKNRKVFEIKKSLTGKDIYPGKEINCRCRAVLY